MNSYHISSSSGVNAPVIYLALTRSEAEEMKQMLFQWIPFDQSPVAQAMHDCIKAQLKAADADA